MAYISKEDIDQITDRKNRNWILNKLIKHQKMHLLISNSSESWWELDRFFNFYNLHHREAGYCSAALTRIIFSD